VCPKGRVKWLICPAIRLRCADNPSPATGFGSKVAFCEAQAVEVYISQRRLSEVSMFLIVSGSESEEDKNQNCNLSCLSVWQRGDHVYLNSFGQSATLSRTLSGWTVMVLLTPRRSRRMRRRFRQTRRTTPGIRSTLQPVRNDLPGDRSQITRSPGLKLGIAVLIAVTPQEPCTCHRGDGRWQGACARVRRGRALSNCP